MEVLMITCPVTGRLVDSGIPMSRDAFDALGLDNQVLHCPQCGRPHVWNRERASLRSEEEAEQRAPEARLQGLGR